MNEMIEQLKEKPKMKFLPAASDNEVMQWEKENGVILPGEYKEWLRFSDGGEIFIPGAQLYGVKHKPLLSYFNQPDERGDLPDVFYVLGEFCFGDLLCFVKGENNIIQWDHENWEEFTRWDNFNAFLSEAEELFGEDM